MIHETMKILLSLSFSGTLLLLLVLLLKPLYRNKFSKRWQYYIYLIVALRFLLPFTPKVSLTGYLSEADWFPGAGQNFAAGLPDSFSQNNTAGLPDSFSQSDTADSPNALRQSSTDFRQDTTIRSASGEGQNSTGIPQDTAIWSVVLDQPARRQIIWYLFYGWAAVTLFMVLRRIIIYRNFVQQIKKESVEVTELKILNLLAACEENLHIRKNMELHLSSLVSSPIMIGQFHPDIILPAAAEMTETEMALIFKHELIHYKRCDLLYKWFIQAIVCLHWFNPFVYLFAKEINQACELSCDEAVIASLAENEKRAYGDMLLSFVKVKTRKTGQNSLASVTLTEGAEQLKERLGAIMKYRKKSKSVLIISLIAVFLLSFTGFSIGVYAAPALPRSSEEPVLPSAKTVPQQDLLSESIPDAEKDTDGDKYTFAHRGYYSEPFVIEIGWNVGENFQHDFPNRAEIPLEDQTVMTVCFDEDVKDYRNDSQAAESLGKLLSTLKGSDAEPALETPYVTGITFVPADKISDFAREFYESRSVTRYAALFPYLNQEEQNTWLSQMYDSHDRIAFFASCTESMDSDTVELYFGKADQDNRVNFLSVLMDFMPQELLETYAEKFYEQNEIGKFSVILSEFTEENKEKWLARAKSDQKITFSAVLADDLSDNF